jgi:glycosyltransferase involved in cell wall biosynthesis
MDTPLISIVIRTFFREKALTMTLESIANLNYPQDKIEVIIIKDSKDDGAEKAVDLIRQKHPQLNVLIENFSINSATRAWNLGIKQSNGEIVCVSPDDVIFHPQTIIRADELLKSNCNVVAVTFTCIFEKQSIASEIHHMRFIGNLTNSVSTIFLLTFYRKSILKTVGLYREDLGPPATIHEDWELGSRIKKFGFRIILDGTMVQAHLEQQGQRLVDVPLENTLPPNAVAKTKRLIIAPFTYANSYLRRNYKTFFEVMKSSPLTQQLEYTFYFFMPILGIVLLFLDTALYSLGYLLLLVVAIDIYSFVNGHYRVFTLKKRLIYPIMLVAIRIVRTYLSLLGFLWEKSVNMLGNLKR